MSIGATTHPASRPDKDTRMLHSDDLGSLLPHDSNGPKDDGAPYPVAFGDGMNPGLSAMAFSVPPVSVPPPSGVSAASHDEAVRLGWVAPSGLTYPPASGYQVYRGGASGGPYSRIDDDGVTVTYYWDTDVNAGNTYYYVLRTVDSDTPPNVSVDSDEVVGAPGDGPSVPESVRLTGTGDTSVDLQWDASTAGTYSLTEYVVYKSTRMGGGFEQAAVVSGTPPATSVTVGNLEPGTRYFFQVRARDAAGNRSGAKGQADGRAFKLDPPSDLTANAGDGRVTLKWRKPAGSTYGVRGYRVYRATQAGGPYTEISSRLVRPRRYVDRTASNGTTYYYVVKAVDRRRNVSDNSNEASATPESASRTLHFEVTTQHSGTETAGASFSVTLRALDSSDQLDTTYTGGREIAWSTTATSSPFGDEPVVPDTESVTFSQGVATVSGFTLYRATEAATITATDTSAGGPSGTSAALIVQPGTVDGLDASTVDVDPSALPNDDTTLGLVTVRLRDGYGNLVSGKSVSLSLTGSGNTISGMAGNGPTSIGVTQDGVVTGTIKSSAAQTVTLSAEDTTDSIALPTVQIRFVDVSAPIDLLGYAGDEEVLLSWTPPGVAPAGGYAIYRGSAGEGSQGSDPAGWAPPSASCYVDAGGLDNDTTYHYFIRARGDGDPPAYATPSNQVAVTPVEADPVAPEPPVEVVASAIDGSVELAWEASAEGTSEISGYEVLRRELPTGGWDEVGSTSRRRLDDPTGLSATAQMGSPGYASTTLYYRVTAVGPGGETLPSDEVSVTIGATTSQVRLSWDAVSGAESYRVYVGTSSGGQSAYFTCRAPVFVDQASSGTAGTPPTANTTSSEAGLRVVDRVASSGTTYAYRVQAYDDGPLGSKSTPSQEVRVTPRAGDGVLSSPDTIEATVAADASGVFEDGTYASYVVTALSLHGETVASPEVTVQVDSGEKVTLSWRAVDGASSYRVYRGTYEDGAPPVPANNENRYTDVATGTTLVDTGTTWDPGVPPQVSFAYLKSPAVPSAPANVSVTTGDGCLRLTWDDSTPGAASIGGYLIYRGDTSGGQLPVPVGTTAGTEFTDGGLQNGLTYYYVVRAFDEHPWAHRGSASSEVSGTPSATAKLLPPGDVGVRRTVGGFGLIGGETYYKVTALNGNGETTPSAEVSIAYTPCPQDANLVTWAPVIGARWYRVYIGRAGTGSQDRYVTVGSTSFLDIGSCAASGTPPTQNTADPETSAAPGAPTAVKAVAGDHQVMLSWSPPLVNAAAVAGYALYRGLRPDEEDSTPVALLARDELGYVDDDVVNGITYYYYLRAYAAASPTPLYGPRSAEVSSTPPGAQAPELAILALSSGRKAISFEGSSDNRVEGTVHSNGGITFQSPSSGAVVFDGDAYAVGSISNDITFGPGYGEHEGADPVPDPGYPLPDLPSTEGAGRLAPKRVGGRRTIDPGAYTSGRLTGRGTIYVKPGVYYFCGGGGLLIAGGVTLEHHPDHPGPVVFVLAEGARLRVAGRSTVRLNSGPEYSNILFYAMRPTQSPSRGQGGTSEESHPRCGGRRWHLITGNCTLDCCGSIYVPADELRVTGSRQAAPCHKLELRGQIVARSLRFTGHSSTEIVYARGCAPGVPSTPAARIVSITPTSGTTEGGTEVTIRGNWFQETPSVWIGGPTTDVTFLSSEMLTAVTTAHDEGAVDVVVTNPDSQWDMIADGYTYVAPPVIDPPGTPVLSGEESEGAALLSWTCQAGSYPVAGYELYKGTTSSGSLTHLTTITDTGYTDLDVDPGQTYYYQVKAFDADIPANESGLSNEVSVSIPVIVTPPEPPVLSAVGGNAVVTVSWAEATAGTYSLDEYRLYRAEERGVAIIDENLVRVEDATGGPYSYQDTDVTNNEDYFYRAVTVDVEGNVSIPSNEVGARPATEYPPPVLHATAGNRQIELEWVLSESPPCTVGGYKLYRGLVSGEQDPTPVHEVTTSAHSGSWTDTDVYNGTQYFYIVKYIDDQTPPAFSAPSNEASAIPSNLNSGLIASLYPHCRSNSAPLGTAKATTLDYQGLPPGSDDYSTARSVRIQGHLDVPETGETSFLMYNNGAGGLLAIDGELVAWVPSRDERFAYPDTVGTPCDENGDSRIYGGWTGWFRTDPIHLNKGLHRIEFYQYYFTQEGSVAVIDQAYFGVRWRLPSESQFGSISADHLFHTLPLPSSCQFDRINSMGEDEAYIHGLGFEPTGNGVQVKVGDTILADTDIAEVTSTRIKCALPMHQHGWTPITVTNVDDDHDGQADYGLFYTQLALSLSLTADGAAEAGSTCWLTVTATRQGASGDVLTDRTVNAALDLSAPDDPGFEVVSPVSPALVDGEARVQVRLTRGGSTSVVATADGPWLAKASLSGMASTIPLAQLKGAGSVAVTPGALAGYRIAISHPDGLLQGETLSAAVQAVDAYGNDITTDTSTIEMLPAGEVTFYEDTGAFKPTRQFTLVDGTATVYMVGAAAETVTLTAVNASDSTIRGSKEITILPYTGVSELTVATETSVVAAPDNYAIGFRVSDVGALGSGDRIILTLDGRYERPALTASDVTINGDAPSTVSITGWPPDPVVVTLTLGAGTSIASDGYVTIALKNRKITNPTIADDYTISVHTTADEKPVTSHPYTISSGTARGLIVLVEGQKLVNGTPDAPENPIWFLSGAGPTAQTVGVPSGANYVYAVDEHYNLVSSLAADVVLTSDDTKAALPDDAVLEEGLLAFSATFGTPGSAKRLEARINATPARPGLAGHSTAIEVLPTSVVERYGITLSDNPVDQGEQFTATVTAYDAYGNVAASTAKLNLGSTSGNVTFWDSAYMTQVFSTALAAGTATLYMKGQTVESVRVTATDSGNLAGESDVLHVVPVGATQVTGVSVTASPDTAGSSSVHTVEFGAANALANDGKIYLTWPTGFDLSALTQSDVKVGVNDGAKQALTSLQYDSDTNQLAIDPQVTVGVNDTVQVAVGDASGNTIGQPTVPGGHAVHVATDADRSPVSATLTLAAGAASSIAVIMEGQTYDENPFQLHGVPVQQTVGVTSRTCEYLFLDANGNTATPPGTPSWTSSDGAAEITLASGEFQVTFGSPGEQTITLSYAGVTSGQATVDVQPGTETPYLPIDPGVNAWGDPLPKDRRMVIDSSGRIAVFYQNGQGIQMLTGSSPYELPQWDEEPTQIVADTSYYPAKNHFSVDIDASNAIWLAYTLPEGISERKTLVAELTPSGSTWQLSGNPAEVDDTQRSPVGAEPRPTILVDGSTLWVAFLSRQTTLGSGSVALHAYRSTNGSSWTAVTDVASQGSGPDTLQYSPALVKWDGKVSVVWDEGDSDTRIRVRQWDSGSSQWGTLSAVTTGDGGFNGGNWSAVETSTDNALQVVGGKATWVSHDGTAWSTPCNIRGTGTDGDTDPALTTDGSDLWCFFSHYYGVDSYTLGYRRYDASTSTWDASDTYITLEVPPLSNRAATSVPAQTSPDYIPVAWLQGVRNPRSLSFAKVSTKGALRYVQVTAHTPNYTGSAADVEITAYTSSTGALSSTDTITLIFPEGMDVSG
ncbi:MAG: hypothetical protein GF320_17205, partial [Armatimonadia bacterium]|nr:hypothetical protein [Armatimonadia bacterium]